MIRHNTGSNPVLTTNTNKMEKEDWDKLWIKHRNAMIQALICGVIIGWCIGICC